MLALPFPCVIRLWAWGRFLCLLLCILLHQIKNYHHIWNIFISVNCLLKISSKRQTDSNESDTSPLNQILFQERKYGDNWALEGQGIIPSWPEASWRCLRIPVLCTNMKDQKKEIVRLWITKKSDNNCLVVSMPRRLQEVIEREGGTTKY